MKYEMSRPPIGETVVGGEGQAWCGCNMKYEMSRPLLGRPMEGGGDVVVEAGDEGVVG